MEGIVGRLDTIKPWEFRLCSTSPLLLSPLLSVLAVRFPKNPFFRAISPRFRGSKCLIRRARCRGRRECVCAIGGTEGEKKSREEGSFDAWLRGARRGCSGRRVVEPVETPVGIGHDEVPENQPGLPPARQWRRQPEADAGGAQIEQGRRRPGRRHRQLAPGVQPGRHLAGAQAARSRSAAVATGPGPAVIIHDPEPSARPQPPLPLLRLPRPHLPELHRRWPERQCRPRRHHAAPVGPEQALARPPRRLGGVRVSEHALPAAPAGRRQDPAPLVSAGGEADAAAELPSRVQPQGQLIPPGAWRRRRRRAPRPQRPPPPPPPPQIRGGACRRAVVVCGGGGVEGGEAAAPGGGQGGRRGDGDWHPRIQASARGRRWPPGRAPRPRVVVEGAGRAEAAAADLHDAVAQGEGGGLPGHEGHQAAPASQEEAQGRREGSQFYLPRDVALGCDQKQV